eukprot:SAG31_NODE_40602_length_280_cov_0.569061_2_plen_26_part_01
MVIVALRFPGTRLSHLAAGVLPSATS